jgi:hypothetical protein
MNPLRFSKGSFNVDIESNPAFDPDQLLIEVKDKWQKQFSVSNNSQKLGLIYGELLTNTKNASQEKEI